MTTREYIRELRNRGVRFQLDGDDIRVEVPGDAMTPDLRETLSARKAELREYLLQNGAARADEESPSPARPPDLEASDDPSPAPLSFGQERMWFLDRMEPGSAAYNRPYAFRIRGSLDPDALRWSVRRVLRRHEALRTRFRMREDEPVQEVRPPPGAEIRTEDLGDADDADERLRKILHEEARAPFDLAEGPLARFLLVRLADDDHVFLHNVHHSVSDGWSTGILHRELEQLYASRIEGDEPALDEPPLQYRDFARWQREWLRDEALEERLDYWRDRLGGDLPVLELPLDHARPPVQSYDGARETGRIGPDVADGVRALAREERGTPFMVLLAAYAALLYRYSGQDDVPIGTPVAGRTRQDTENVIGLFINTLVLRTDVGGDPTFRELVHRIRNTALEAMEHQEVPFEKVVEAVQPERSVSHHPLFQVLFTYQDDGDRGLDLPGLDVSRLEVDRGATYMDLDLIVAEDGEQMDLALRYNTDLFDAGTAERLLSHYRTLLAGAVERPDRSVSDLPLLTDPERRTLIEGWNDTAVDLGRPRPIHRLVEEQAQRTPDEVALISASERLSYRELDERASRLARRLEAEGVGAGSLVGVSTARSAALPVSVLGVLKAGGAYLPLDPSLPAERIRFMLEDGGATAVVADDEGDRALPAVDVIQIRIDERGVPQGASPGGPEPDRDEAPAEARESATADDLAYTIYTSGSTGRPKGVQIPHRTAFNFIRSMEREPGMDRDDAILAVTTLSFDISVLELFLPLSVGARVVLADERTAADGFGILDALREHEITTLQATPATWRLLLEAGWEGEDRLRVLCGGEAMPPDLARDLTERSDEVWNLYGPTETTVWSARYRVPPEGEPVRIGRPIENTRIYILDSAGNPVPVGAPGELFIAGAGVARGYHDRPEKNARAFVPDPFAEEDDERMYRTGDRARWRPDGTLEFLGRMDHQVKIRGFRIELGEVESVLSELDEVEEAVTAVRADRVDDKRLVAYVVFREGRALTVSEVRRALLEKLPDYMVPSLVVEMEDLPLTPSGKVNRNALPDPLESGAGGRADFAEPATPAERAVADIWRDLLGVEKIGKRDNFFDLGGHSLLSMRAVHRVEAETGERLNPRVMILETLEQIAAEVEDRFDGSESHLEGAET